MKYKEYIDLGFDRTDVNDAVVFDVTGYSGFYLTRHINDRMYVYVTGEELDCPTLIINKGNTEGSCHRVKLNDEMVRDMFLDKKT
jgi:hypothetical protein